MVALVWIINILLIVMCIAMVAVVLMQDTKGGGMGEAFGGGGTDSFYSKNKSRGKEAQLSNLTKILACAIAVLSVVMVMLTKNM